MQARSQVCVTRGGKVTLEGSRGTKSESLFHASCCYNQIDNVCAGEYCSYVTKTKVEFIHNFRRFLLSYNNNATTRTVQKQFPGVVKNWHLITQGGICNPMLPHGYGPGLITRHHSKTKIESLNCKTKTVI